MVREIGLKFQHFSSLFVNVCRCCALTTRRSKNVFEREMDLSCGRLPYPVATRLRLLEIDAVD